MSLPEVITKYQELRTIQNRVYRAWLRVAKERGYQNVLALDLHAAYLIAVTDANKMFIELFEATEREEQKNRKAQGL